MIRRPSPSGRACESFPRIVYLLFIYYLTITQWSYKTFYTPKISCPPTGGTARESVHMAVWSFSKPGWVPGGSQVGPLWIPVGLFESKIITFSNLVLEHLAGGWLPLGSMFGDFSNCLASLFGAWHLYRLPTDLGIEFDVISNVYLMICPFAHSPCETLFSTTV